MTIEQLYEKRDAVVERLQRDMKEFTESCDTGKRFSFIRIENFEARMNTLRSLGLIGDEMKFQLYAGIEAAKEAVNNTRKEAV